MALGQSFVSCPDLQYISVYRDLAFLFSVFLFLKSKYPSGFSLKDHGSNTSQVEEPSSAQPGILLVLHDRGCPLKNNTLSSFLTS